MAAISQRRQTQTGPGRAHELRDCAPLPLPSFLTHSLTHSIVALQGFQLVGVREAIFRNCRWNYRPGFHRLLLRRPQNFARMDKMKWLTEILSSRVEAREPIYLFHCSSPAKVRRGARRSRDREDLGGHGARLRGRRRRPHQASQVENVNARNCSGKIRNFRNSLIKRTTAYNGRIRSARGVSGGRCCARRIMTH